MPDVRLTPAQRRVMRAVSLGKRNREIACDLGLTENTVKQYLFTLMKKVGAANRTQLALWALRHCAL